MVVTSRFPYDALQRLIQEPDFEDWKDRIHIYGLDFRQVQRVEEFALFLGNHFPYIDIVINNAAQTVRMSEEEYRTLAVNETELKNRLSGNQLSRLASGETLVSRFGFSGSTSPDQG